MIRAFIGGSLLALTLAAPAFSQTSRSTASQSAARASALPAGFNVAFSIFARDRRVGNTDGVGGYRSVQAPVFVGVLQDQSGMTGFIRFSSRGGDRQILAVHPGDLIPSYGIRVETLSLDSIVLSAEGQPQRIISVGQALPGGPLTIPAYGY